MSRPTKYSPVDTDYECRECEEKFTVAIHPAEGATFSRLDDSMNCDAQPEWFDPSECPECGAEVDIWDAAQVYEDARIGAEENYQLAQAEMRREME